MKFVIGAASRYIYNYSIEQIKDLDTYFINRFKEDVSNMENTIKEYTNIPLSLENVKFATDYTAEGIEYKKIARLTAEVNSLEELVNLSKKCRIIIDYDSYSIPYIEFYDDYIE